MNDEPAPEIVFNCTAALPYSRENLLMYALAVGIDPAQWRDKALPVSVRHDEDSEDVCLWCKTPVDTSELYFIKRKNQ